MARKAGLDPVSEVAIAVEALRQLVETKVAALSAAITALAAASEHLSTTPPAAPGAVAATSADFTAAFNDAKFNSDGTLSKYSARLNA